MDIGEESVRKEVQDVIQGSPRENVIERLIAGNASTSAASTTTTTTTSTATASTTTSSTGLSAANPTAQADPAALDSPKEPVLEAHGERDSEGAQHRRVLPPMEGTELGRSFSFEKWRYGWRRTVWWPLRCLCISLDLPIL